MVSGPLRGRNLLDARCRSRTGVSPLHGGCPTVERAGQQRLVAEAGVEPTLSGSEPLFLPLKDSALVNPSGLEPEYPGSKPGALTVERRVVDIFAVGTVVYHAGRYPYSTRILRVPQKALVRAIVKVRKSAEYCRMPSR